MVLFWIGIRVASAVLLLDLLSKNLALQALFLKRRMIVFPSGDALIPAWNRGFNASVTGDLGPTPPQLLILLGLFAAALMILWLRKSQNQWNAAVLGMVLGGVLGNVIDRIRFGAVIDFLYINDLNHWFGIGIFNVADFFIVFALLVTIFLIFARNALGFISLLVGSSGHPDPIGVGMSGRESYDHK